MKRCVHGIDLDKTFCPPCQHLMSPQSMEAIATPSSLNETEKEALGIALKFRIPLLLDIEARAKDRRFRFKVRSQINALTSAATKLELP